MLSDEGELGVNVVELGVFSCFVMLSDDGEWVSMLSEGMSPVIMNWTSDRVTGYLQATCNVPAEKRDHTWYKIGAHTHLL